MLELWSRRLGLAAALCVLGATTVAHAQSQGTWEMKAPVPAALNEVTVAEVGGKIHVIGGAVLGVAGPYHVEYDPATDKWRPRALLPRGLDRIGSAVLNGKIYTVGGFIGSVHKDGQSAAYEYDPLYRLTNATGREHVFANAVLVTGRLIDRVELVGDDFGRVLDRHGRMV